MSMKKAICGFIFHKLLGWTQKVSVPDYNKYILCAAPHTSNWDLIMGKLFYCAMGRKSYFMMKKEWFVQPLGWFFRSIGGIPVDRGKKTSMVDQMVELAAHSRIFHLAITPEGTRSANGEWKRGFYYIALKAQIPIVLVGIDYPSKCITMEKEIIPSGDIDKDMREIKLYFQQFKGKHPEQFSIGDIEPKQ